MPVPSPVCVLFTNTEAAVGYACAYAGQVCFRGRTGLIARLQGEKKNPVLGTQNMS